MITPEEQFARIGKQNVVAPNQATAAFTAVPIAYSMSESAGSQK